MKDLANKIRLRREELGLSQEDLAAALGYKHKSSINKIELGLADVPRAKVPAFAAALRMDVGEFSGWSEKRKDDSFSYCLEQQLHTLGYDLTYTPDGDIILQHAGVAYEITEQDVKDLEARVAFMIRFAVEDLTKNARKIGG